MKKDRVYILGKATNLTNRLSTYNKSDEHEVVYYQGCGDEETMSISREYDISISQGIQRANGFSEPSKS